MKKLFLLLSFIAVYGTMVFGQQYSGLPNSTLVQAATPYYSLIPISATAAVGTQTLLTIPAPQIGYYNYVCDLKYEVSSDGTGAVISDGVTTSGNFNSFAIKFSQVITASIDSGVQTVLGPYNPGIGCMKSAQAGVATTFAGLSSGHGAFTYYASYYQAP